MVTLRPRPSLHYPRQPLHEFLRVAADRHGERVALRYDNDCFTYRDLDARGTAFGNAVRRFGLGLGDRLLLAAANRPEWLMVVHGLSQLGVAAVLANSSWRAAELQYALTLTKPRAIVADRPVIDILAHAGLDLPEIKISLDDDARSGWHPIWDVIDGASGQRPGPLDADLARLEAVLPFSSGTTGLPKAVRHSHASLTAAVIQRCASYRISDQDRMQFFMPLFTIYGVLVTFSSFAAGAPLRLFRRFDAPTILRNLQDEKITIAFGAAPVAVALRSQPDLESYDLSALRYMMWGATPVIPEIAMDVARRAGIRWFVAYATTEAGVAANPIECPDRWRLDSPGLPLPDVTVRVVDPGTGFDVDPGETGEFLVRGPSVMLGYLPETDNADAFLPGGWLRTGDIGWIEPEGWLHLTDRSKEMIKVSGFQVAPAELEHLLFTHPLIADCAVYGVANLRTGEAPNAAVVRTSGSELTEQDVINFVAQRLSTYKHLRAVRFVDAIPRNPAGKVLRRLLRDADPETAARSTES
jgi:acyl-CoA synthetase (AMP-forming)/AMP-acid ligase II